jgi:NAD-dependent SIR2 family protein deacetylase
MSVQGDLDPHQALGERLLSPRSATVLTGAGISAEPGVPTLLEQPQ